MCNASLEAAGHKDRPDLTQESSGAKWHEAPYSTSQSTTRLIALSLLAGLLSPCAPRAATAQDQRNNSPCFGRYFPPAGLHSTNATHMTPATRSMPGRSDLDKYMV